MNNADTPIDSAGPEDFKQIRQLSIEATPARKLERTKQNFRARLRFAGALGAEMGVYSGVAAGCILSVIFCLGGGLSGQPAGTRFFTLTLLFFCGFGVATMLGYAIGLLVAVLRPVHEPYRYLPERLVPILLCMALLIITAFAASGVYHESAYWKLVTRAQVLTNGGQFLEARKVLDQAVHQPAPLGVADANCLRGWIHAQRADFSAALVDYNEALREDPGHLLSLKNRAWAHDCLGQDGDALKDYESVLRLEPGSAWAFKYRSEVLARNGRIAEALADLAEVSRLESANPWPQWRQAELLLKSSQPSAALQAADKAVQLDSSSPASYLARARARLALGQLDEARADLVQARQLDPRDPAIKREFDSCQARIQVGRCTAALASATHPCHELVERGQAYLTLGELVRARADFERAREHEPRNANVCIWLGNLHMKQREYALAASEYKQAVKLAPDSALAVNNLGKAHSQLGALQQAVEDFQRALALDPQLPEAHYNLGRLAFKAGDYPQAIRELDFALEYRPGWSAALNLRGRAHLAEKAYDRALFDFETCLRQEPERTPLWHHLLALTYERKGNASAAVSHHRQAVEGEPRNADYYHALGRAYLADAQYERGLTELQRARWIGCKGPAFLNELAWAHHLIRDYAQAIAIYDLALELNPDDAWILYRRALANLRLSRDHEALADLDRALRLRPDYDAAVHIRKAIQPSDD